MTRLWLLLAAVPLLGDVRVTYLANEGVLVTSGDTKVLVDALFRDSLGDYTRHDARTQEQLETGKHPFDGVALALATHYHLDHWDAGAISRFLTNNASAVFASTPQATGMIPRSLRGRVRVLWPGGNASLRFEARAATVEAFPLGHGETQNLGYALSVGGRLLLHLGDAEPSAANFEVLAARPRPDVALVPFWWLLDEAGRAFVAGRWKPAHVIAIHLGEKDAAMSAAKVRISLPGAWVCTKIGETRTF
jgi:L-ascorbate metabolism protein UlaG (beta-lactamase superfamily)